MASKAITERREDGGGFQWKPPAELAPSNVKDQGPLFGRIVGALSLMPLVLGGVSLLVHAAGRSSIINPTLGWLLTLLGVGGLLAHAANEADFQLRRAYMAVGLLLLAIGGALLGMMLFKASAGSYFLPQGAGCLLVGLLFLLGFLRNETDQKLRDTGLYIVGGAGVALEAIGFVMSNIQADFLFSHGLIVIGLGLIYLWAFIGFRGVMDDFGYYAALKMGVLGGVVMLIAVVRSLLHPMYVRGWLSQDYPSYWMPNGLLLFAVGLIYIGLALGAVSESSYVVMTRRELASYFHSPIAYFMLLLFTAVAGFQFLLFVFEALWDPTTPPGLAGAGASPALVVQEPMIRPFVFSLVSIFCVVFLVPILTMRLLSEEQRTGTLEMTLTAPQEEVTVVLSKFTAALVLYMLTCAPWALYLVALRFEGGQPFDYLPLLAWLIVLVFSGAGFIAMGVFFSSVTRNQLTAAVLTFVGMLLLVGLFLLKQNVMEPGGLWNTVFSRVSFVDSWWHALDGKLGVGDLFYHLTVAVIFLFLTVVVLASRRWR